jgi:catechol 2,3-dioxygenase-like lactoylglutathione lyase family enzyme
MIKGARYVHTNLIARDWQRLARFYQETFGCVPVPPERNLSGAEMEAGTGVPGARLHGMHLRLPGVGPDGPTLEIFEYSEPAPEAARLVNRPGFAHIAFAVDSVADARAGSVPGRLAGGRRRHRRRVADGARDVVLRPRSRREHRRIAVVELTSG